MILLKFNLFSFIVGSIIGFSQVYIRIFLNNKINFQSLLILSIVILSYIFAGFIWLRILKSPVNLTSCYSFAILGTFNSLIISKQDWAKCSKEQKVRIENQAVMTVSPQFSGDDP